MIPMEQHFCSFVVPTAWKRGISYSLDEVGGYRYYFTQVSELACECGKVRQLNRIFNPKPANKKVGGLK